MCYFSGSSGRTIPATRENLLKYGPPTIVATTVDAVASDSTVDNDIQRRQRALRNQPENQSIYKTKLGV